MTADTDELNAERDPADVIAEEFAARLRKGERPSVSEYSVRHPALAEQLRDLLPAVAQMEQLKRFRKAPAADPRPDRLGDFRIVREVGRGGMGLVFEAVQESLGRSVALKLLARHALLEPTRRSRFLREAQAAAKLHHTNIVPVFGVGEQDDMPYYVMQLIAGCGLHTLIARWRNLAQVRPGASTVELRGPQADTESSLFTSPPPSDHGPQHRDWAFVARVGAEAADALDYAHNHGVLHRDVKPGNLLLDEDHRVWVTDFGLAKQTNEQALTATGDVVGTLQYLPPEFLNGQSDARSDVYGLGATLYELLTLRPPFDAATPAGLMKLLAEGDPTPPRAIEPSVPRDLETIVLKALAREPARRYQTAHELRDDLKAFLDDRPIRARRMSAAARGWRVCRKNPLAASLAATTAFCLLLVLMLGWGNYVRTQRAFEREESKRIEAEKATAKLQSNLDLSLDAFDDLFRASETTDGWGGPFAPGGPGGGPGRSPDGFGRPQRGPDGGGPDNVGRAGNVPMGGKGPNDDTDKAVVLERVLAFYDKFAEQNSTNPKLQFEAAKAHRRVGELHNRMNQFERAAVAFRRASEILDELKVDSDNQTAILAEKVLTHAHSPDYPKTPAGRAEAERRWQRAIDLGRTGSKDDNRFTLPVVDAYVRLAMARSEGFDSVGEEANYRDARRWLVDRRVDDRGPPREFFQARIDRLLTQVLIRQRKYAEAKELLDESIAELVPLDRFGSREPSMMRPVLADLYRNLAEVLRHSDDPRGADEAQRTADRLAPLQRSEGRGPDNRGSPGGRSPFDGQPPPAPRPN